MDLQNRVAVVTGGASGLGRATVDELARRGARIAIFDLNAAAGAEAVATVVAQPGQPADSDALEGLGGREVMEHGAGQFAVQAADVASELREAQIDETVQLTHAVAEVLHEPVPVTHELSQFLGRLIR